jgi:septal ring factor EnvC (AmiA/AmiB activator)
MKGWHFVSLCTALAAGGIAFAQPDATPAGLKSAQEDARQSLARSEALEQEAAKATNEADRARAETEALAARIQAAEADITAAETRSAIVDNQLRDQRARLAERQGPLIRLTAALQSLGRRPPALALVQPGSLNDAVRVRAILSATLPRIRERTAAVRGEIDRARTLRSQQETARQALVDSRAALAGRRDALARMEAEQRARSAGFSQLALRESDRALALGEEARRIEGLTEDRAFREQLAANLATLPGPTPRPAAGGAAPPAGPTFVMPATGRVVQGVGELSDAGVHARGVVLEVDTDAAVRAPAAGRVAYAGPFRSYGLVLILDHGGGWTSVVTGLAGLGVQVGNPVERGGEIGRARGGEERLTVELRYQGRPVPITSLLAAQ